MQVRFCKDVLRLLPGTVNGAVEYGLVWESRNGRMFCRIGKFWCRNLQVEEDLLDYCYDWQIVNLKWKSWACILREENLAGMFLAEWTRLGCKSNMSKECN